MSTKARQSQRRARAVALGLMVPRVSADGWLWVFCRAPELHIQQQLLQRLRLWGGHPAPPGYVHGHGWLHGHPLKVPARTSHAWKSLWGKHGAVQISWEAKPSLSGVRAGRWWGCLGCTDCAVPPGLPKSDPGQWWASFFFGKTNPPAMTTVSESPER